MAGAPVLWHGALGILYFMGLRDGTRVACLEVRANGSGLGSWVKGQLHSSTAGGGNGGCSKADLRVMLGMIGATLAHVHLTSLDPFLHLEGHSH
ncbi:hypothetical protein SAY86_008786 [Trapa natans]|uniref:Uncharacterized protein n=1 Tax=Trapa natans TaxID=22666 RepID=A0AAN7K705_TRANT|nr:hypothetical protein SAY86_008786 [Trapa natans]